MLHRPEPRYVNLSQILVLREMGREGHNMYVIEVRNNVGFWRGNMCNSSDFHL